MASDSVSLLFRSIVIEDFGFYTSLSQVNLPVIGVGDSVPVTPVISAASDVAATNAGLGIGDVYINTSLTPIRMRANSGGSGSPVTKISGTTTQTPGTIADGICLLLATLSIAGAILGDPVIASSTPPLPTGVQVIGKVSSAGSVNIEVWNFSALPQTIGSTVFNVTIIH